MSQEGCLLRASLPAACIACCARCAGARGCCQASPLAAVCMKSMYHQTSTNHPSALAGARAAAGRRPRLAHSRGRPSRLVRAVRAGRLPPLLPAPHARGEAPAAVYCMLGTESAVQPGATRHPKLCIAGQAGPCNGYKHQARPLPHRYRSWRRLPPPACSLCWPWLA